MTCSTVICKLMESGANVNAQDNYGMTPLHYSAMRGNAMGTTELLKSNNINLGVSMYFFYFYEFETNFYCNRKNFKYCIYSSIG